MEASGGTPLRGSKSVPSVSMLKEGSLLKRQGRSKALANLNFQKRTVRLTTTYFEIAKLLQDKKRKGNFSVSDIHIVENVQDGEFGSFYFQIGTAKEVVYFRAKTEKERKEWMETFRLAVNMAENTMLSKYHPGVFNKGIPHQWSCCNNGMKNSIGCCEASQTKENCSEKPTKISSKFHTAHMDDKTLSLSLPECEDSDFTPPVDLSYEPTTSSTSCRQMEIPGKHGGNSTPHLSIKRYSLISADSGIDSELGKSGSSFNLSNMGTQEATPDTTSIRKKITEEVIQESDDSSTTSSSDSESVGEGSLCTNFRDFQHHSSRNLDFDCSINTVSFRGIDQLVVATKKKICLMDMDKLNSEVVYENNQEEIKSISTWRSMVAVRARSGVTTILDLNDKNFSLNITSNSGCPGDFTPDGSTFIVPDQYPETSSDTNTDTNIMKVQGISLSDKLPAGSEAILLSIHPDPQEHLVALIIPDQLTNVLYLHVYNYKAENFASKRTCIGSVMPKQYPHSVFSHFNLKLYILYGSIFTVVDVKTTSVYQEKLALDEDTHVSSIQFSPMGKELAIGLTNGYVLMLDGRSEKVVYNYQIDTELSTPITSISFSKNSRILAIGYENGKLQLYEKLPARHPAEASKMTDINISTCGQNVRLDGDISIDFPEGLMDEESPVKFSYATTAGELFGPFILPPESRLISAILSLHPEKKVTFKKPIKITMPHCLHLENETDTSRISFCKACQTDYDIVNGQKVFRFTPMSPDEKVCLFSELKQLEDCGEVQVPFASLYSHHCCYQCIVENINPKQTSDESLLFILQAKPKHLGKTSDYTIEYIVTQALKHCLETIEKQYPSDDYEIQKRLVSFKGQCYSITLSITSVEKLESDGWNVSIGNRKKISRLDMDFIDIPEYNLKCMCKEKEYPPHFSIKVSLSSRERVVKDSDLTVKFLGSQEKACGKGVEPELTAKLLVSDICHQKEDEPPIIISESSIGGHNSCEARAIQKQFEDIAEVIKDQIQTIHVKLFSGMVLTRDQVDQIKSSIPQTEEDKTSLSCEIMFDIHSNISKNCRLFDPFCKVLKRISQSNKSVYANLRDTYRRLQRESLSFIDCYSDPQPEQEEHPGMQAMV